MSPLDESEGYAMKSNKITVTLMVLLMATLMIPMTALAGHSLADRLMVGQENEECFEAFEGELMDYLGIDEVDELFDLLDSMSDGEIDEMVNEAGLMDMLMACEDGEPLDDRDDSDVADEDDHDGLPDGDSAATGDNFFMITGVPDEVHAAFKAFSQYVNVFGVHIFATDDVTDVQVLHTANVMAQYLDNDGDGEPDNPLVVEAMIENQAAMVVFADEDDLEGMIDQLELTFDEGILSQDLYGTEIHPDGGDDGQFDATLEEVLHLITHAGYAEVYPDIFGEESGTAVAAAMDVARGGHFESIPSAYPPEAWYRYDDPTCDYSCQITEYIYWSLTSILGAQAAGGRLGDIEEEWRLNTAEKVESGDPLIYGILTDPDYGLPRVLPDGHYQLLDEAE
jgi:hypothetical protein